VSPFSVTHRFAASGSEKPGAVFVLVVLSALAASDLYLASAFTSRFPYLDDWELVPYVTTGRPASLHWLWEQHNEHRIPIPKALNYALARLTRMDGRIGSILNALVLVAASAVCVWGIRRARGRLFAGDAFIPLLFLNWAHWDNVTFPFQIQIVGGTFFLCGALVTLLASSGQPSRRNIAMYGLALLALAGCGANGLIPASILSVWLVRHALRGARARPGRDAIATLMSAGFALLCCGYLASYFVGYRAAHAHPSSPSLAAAAATGLRCLTMPLGPAGAAWWPVSVALVIAAVGAGALVAILGMRVNCGERHRAGSVLLAMLAMVSLAAAIGYGRAGLGAEHGFVARYATLMCPILFVAYSAVQIGAGATAARANRVLLCGLMLAVLPINTREAWRNLHLRKGVDEAFLTDIRAGLPPEALAARYAPAYYPPSKAAMAQRLRLLAQGHCSVFREVVPPESWERASQHQPASTQDRGTPAVE
jgi:hypothetical protein